MELFQSTAFCVWPLVGRSSNIQKRIGNLGLEQRQQQVRNPKSSKSSSSVSTKADYYYYEDDDDSEAEEADTNKKLQKMKSDELDWAARARQLAIQDMRIRNFTDQDFEALLPPHLRLSQKMKKKKKTTKKKKKETAMNEFQSSSSALKSKAMKQKKAEDVVKVEDQEVEEVDPEQLKALVRKFNSRRDRYLDSEDEQGEEEDDMQQLSVVYADLQKSDEDDEDFFLSDSDEDEAPVVRKDPKLSEIHLNQDLVEARDVDEVLDAVSRAKERKIQLSEINIATALHRIAKHMVSASMHESRRLTYARQSDISQLVAAAVELLPGCGAQAISNIAWALSKIGGSLLYVGEMEVLSRVAETKVDDMNSQNVANVAGAFATMQHASPDLFRKLGIRASVLASEFKAQEIVQLLWSFACLGLSRESVEPFLDALDEGVDDEENEGGEDDDEEDDDEEFSFDLLCSVAWSYAVFGDLQRSFFRKICGRIKSFDGDTSIGQHRNLRQLTQLYQVMLAMKLEGDEDGGLVFGDRMQKLAAAAWEKERSSKKATSFLQKDMERFLVCTGRKWIPEFVDSEYSLDFACVDGKVAIEVNGPSHYARNTGELLGHTLLKHRLLTVAGWKVILASYAEWEDLDGESEHVEFLQKLVNPHFNN